MIYVDRDKPLDVPKAVATCADCGETLWIEIEEWEPATGEITEEGFEVHCDDESREYDLHYFDTDPYATISVRDWLPIQAKIYAWLTANVRVAQATKADLDAWAEAVKDWQVAT